MKEWILAQSIAVKITLGIAAAALVGAVGFGGYAAVTYLSKPTETVVEAQPEVSTDAKTEDKDVQTDSPVTVTEDEKVTEATVEKEDQKEEANETETTEIPAAEQPQILVNTTGELLNGSFSENADYWEVYAFNNDGFSYNVDAANGCKLNISDTGDQDWHVQLKQVGVKLEQGKWYKFTIQAKSSINRKITCALQRNGLEDDVWTPYSSTSTFSLSNNWDTYSVIFNMKEATDESAVFNLSMGTIAGERITTAHSVCVKNVTMEKLPDNWLDTLKKGDNLLGNADFEYGDILWNASCVAPGEAEIAFGENKVMFGITNPGTLDWHVQLKQSGIRFDDNSGYRLTFRVGSTAGRTIKIGFMDENYVVWYGGDDIYVPGGQTRDVCVQFFNDSGYNPNVQLMISMGKIEGEDTLPAVITLSDLKLVKCDDVPKNSGGGYNGGNGGGDPFTVLNSGWQVYDHECKYTSGSSVDGNGVIKINVNNTGTEDWHIQLQKKGITLEKDKYYKMSYKIKSSIDRTIKGMMQKDGAADNVWTIYNNYNDGVVTLTGGADWKTVESTFKMTSATDNAVIYNFSFGTMDGASYGAHTIEIKDIKIEETEAPPAVTTKTIEYNITALHQVKAFTADIMQTFSGDDYVKVTAKAVKDASSDGCQGGLQIGKIGAEGNPEQVNLSTNETPVSLTAKVSDIAYAQVLMWSQDTDGATIDVDVTVTVEKVEAPEGSGGNGGTQGGGNTYHITALHTPTHIESLIQGVFDDNDIVKVTAKARLADGSGYCNGGLQIGFNTGAAQIQQNLDTNNTPVSLIAKVSEIEYAQVLMWYQATAGDAIDAVVEVTVEKVLPYEFHITAKDGIVQFQDRISESFAPDDVVKITAVATRDLEKDNCNGGLQVGFNTGAAQIQQDLDTNNTPVSLTAKVSEISYAQVMIWYQENEGATLDAAVKITVEKVTP